MDREEELRKVLAECVLQEKIEAGEVRLALRKSCPFCDENISPNARKCPHCQSILDPALLPKPDFLDHAAAGLVFLIKLCLGAFLLLMFLGFIFVSAHGT